MTGLMVGAAVVGLGSVAAADEPTLDEQAEITETIAVVEDNGVVDGTAIEAFEISSESEAVFERYDQCLADAGVEIFEFEAIDGDEAAFVDELESMTETEWEATEEQWGAAAETCDPILEELPEDAFVIDNLAAEFEDFEISPEDEAVFERYDECLSEAGVPVVKSGLDDLEVLEGEIELSELTDEDWAELEEFGDEDWAALDEAHEQAFETCDPILEDLSDDSLFLAEGCEDLDGECLEGDVFDGDDDDVLVTPAEQA